MTGEAQTRTYRGKTLDELIPRIREELGPDAVIVRQRDGLTGGLAGFFQKPFVEVEAQAGARSPRFDAYDDLSDPSPGRRFAPADDASEAVPAPPPEHGPATGAYPASAFLAALQAAQAGGREPAAPEPAPPGPAVEGAAALQAPPAEPAPEDAAALQAPPAEPEPEDAAALQAPPTEPEPGTERFVPLAAAAGPGEHGPVGARPRPPAAQGLERALADAGLSGELAAELVRDAVSHLLPFASPRRLKALVRLALAHRIPVAGIPAGERRVVAFVGAGGAGKTLCTARMCAAYAAGSDLPVACVALRQRDGGALLTALLDGAEVDVAPAPDAAAARVAAGARGARGVVVVDTPTVSPHDAGAVRALAADLAALGAEEVHLAVPATLSASAAGELVEGCAPLGVTALALTHADETAHLGHAVQLAIRTGLPLSYVGRGTAVPGGLAPADPHELAARVLP